jgi:hypothetical protein
LRSIVGRDRARVFAAAAALGVRRRGVKPAGALGGGVRRVDHEAELVERRRPARRAHVPVERRLAARDHRRRGEDGEDARVDPRHELGQRQRRLARGVGLAGALGELGAELGEARVERLLEHHGKGRAAHRGAHLRDQLRVQPPLGAAVLAAADPAAVVVGAVGAQGAERELGGVGRREHATDQPRVRAWRALHVLSQPREQVADGAAVERRGEREGVAPLAYGGRDRGEEAVEACALEQVVRGRE